MALNKKFRVVFTGIVISDEQIINKIRIGKKSLELFICNFSAEFTQKFGE